MINSRLAIKAISENKNGYYQDIKADYSETRERVAREYGVEMLSPDELINRITTDFMKNWFDYYTQREQLSSQMVREKLSAMICTALERDSHNFNCRYPDKEWLKNYENEKRIAIENGTW